MGADPSRLAGEPGEELRCARHPQVETALTCARCGTPICPRCLIQTPVGAKCPPCANVSRIPTIDVKPVFLIRGLGAALVSGALVGFVWALLSGGRAAGFAGIFIIFIAMGIGWAVGESVSAATNRKRSTSLQACAVVGVILAYLVRNAVVGLPLLPAGDIWGYLAVAFAAMFAIGRLNS